MNEGSNKFHPNVEKERIFFSDKGPLTKKEHELTKHLLPFTKERIAILKGNFPLVDPKIIEKDVKDIARKLDDIKATNEKITRSNREHAFAVERGALSEQVIMYGLKAGEWFGKGVSVKVASLFDDLFHGVDGIIEFDPTKHLTIGIDTTISKVQIEIKIQKVKRRMLKDGKLTEVKYFKNENYTGSLHNVSHAVVGASLDMNNSLASTVYDIESTDQSYSGDKPDKKDTAKRLIKKHDMQFILLFEIEMQLEVFAKFAEKIGESNLARILKADLEKIRAVLDERTLNNKQEKERKRAMAKGDDVYKTIEQVLTTEFGAWKETPIQVAKIKPMK